MSAFSLSEHNLPVDLLHVNSFEVSMIPTVNGNRTQKQEDRI